jgi:hypothetical protein
MNIIRLKAERRGKEHTHPPGEQMDIIWSKAERR